MSAVAERSKPALETGAQPRPLPPVRELVPWQLGIGRRIAELWRNRRMVPYYGHCYVQRRYRNTWLGWIWLPLRPALDTLGKAFLFGGLLSVQYGDRPSIIFIAFGGAGWLLFQRTSYWGARSMRVSRSFVRNAHPNWSPKLFAITIPAAVEFLLSVAVALIFVIVYWITRGTLYLVPSKEVLLGFAGVFFLGAMGLALGLCLAPFSQFTRDVRFSFVYVMQFWYFITPVVYDIDHIPKQYRPLAEYNPLTAPVELVRHGFLGAGAPSGASLLIAACGLAVLMSLGLWMLNRFEKGAVARL